MNPAIDRKLENPLRTRENLFPAKRALSRISAASHSSSQADLEFVIYVSTGCGAGGRPTLDPLVQAAARDDGFAAQPG